MTDETPPEPDISVRTEGGDTGADAKAAPDPRAQAREDQTTGVVEADENQSGPPAEVETETADEPDEDVSLEEQAKYEAQRFLENADGASKTERLQNALEELRSQHNTLQQQEQSMKQSLDKLQTKAEEIRDTIEAVHAVDGEREILVTYEGGVTIPKPPEEHGEVLAELNETEESIDSRIETITEKVETVQMTAEKARLAIQRLQQTHETLTNLDTFEG